MATPLEKIAEEKNGNYQSSLKGGGGVPHIGKRPIYFRFFLSKASLSWRCENILLPMMTDLGLFIETQVLVSVLSLTLG